MLSLDFDIIIVNTGPAGLRADFHLTDHSPSISLPMIDMKEICSGGLLKDCKQKYTYPIGFKTVNWTKEEAERLTGALASGIRAAEGILLEN